MGLLSYSRKRTDTLPSDATLLYEILTDYDSYNEWLPFIKDSKLLAREGDLAIAEFELAKRRAGKFAIECIHTRNKMVLVRRIAGRAPVTQVEWTLESTDAANTRVTVEIQGTQAWKRVLSPYSRFADSGRWLSALRSRAACFAPGAPIPDAEGETIIEISETDEGLVCWLRGKKYILQPAPEGKP